MLQRSTIIVSTLSAALCLLAPLAFAHEHDMAAAAPEVGITAKVSPSKDLAPNAAANLTLTLTTADGKPVNAADLKAPHGEKVHLLAIDSSLTDYQHIHPKAGTELGTYTFSFTPLHSGVYHIFADIQPSAMDRDVYIPATFTVTGDPAPLAKTVSNEATVDGYKFKLDTGEVGPSVGHEQSMTLHVEDAKGQPVKNLEPIMKAFGHVVVFNEDAAGVSHLHPAAEPKSDTERAGPDLEFHADFATGGFKKVFAQVQIGGKTITAPFGLQVTGDAPKADVIMVNNKDCPVTGDANGDMGDILYVDYNGYRVGLCCDGCPKKFKKDPEKYLKLALADEKLKPKESKASKPETK